MAACPLTTGFNLDCVSSKGGVKKIWVIPSASKGTMTIGASGNISSWTGIGNNIFGYELRRGAALYEPESVGDLAAGTVHYPGQLTYPLLKMDAIKRNELKLLCGQPTIQIVKDMNGIYWVNGEDAGCTVNSKGTSGQQLGDFNGHNLTVTWDEPEPPYYLDSAVVTALGLT